KLTRTNPTRIPSVAGLEDWAIRRRTSSQVSGAQRRIIGTVIYGFAVTYGTPGDSLSCGTANTTLPTVIPTIQRMRLKANIVIGRSGRNRLFGCSDISISRQTP